MRGLLVFSIPFYRGVSGLQRNSVNHLKSLSYQETEMWSNLGLSPETVPLVPGHTEDSGVGMGLWATSAFQDTSQEPIIYPPERLLSLAHSAAETLLTLRGYPGSLT